MNEISKKILSLLFLTSFILFSCDDSHATTYNVTTPTVESEPETIDVPEPSEPTVIAEDDESEDESDEKEKNEETEETYIAEEPAETEEIQMQAIQEFDAYFCNGPEKNKSLWGVSATMVDGVSQPKVEKIDILSDDGNNLLLSDFYKKDGILFFSIYSGTDYTDQKNPVDSFEYFKQSDETVSSVKTFSKPKITRITVAGAEFTIKDATYNGETYSDCRNIGMGCECRMNIIDSYYLSSGVGIFLNAPEGFREVRKPGLYFFSVKQKSVTKLKEKGELW